MLHVVLAALLSDQSLPEHRPVHSAQELCSTAAPSAETPNAWSVAAKLVEQAKYIAAATVYYQFFRCDKGWMPIPSTLVLDYHQVQPFDAALRQAASGNFTTAITGLKAILKVLPQFGEARFLLGVFQWSAGLHAEARASWRGTITGPYFTLPPDAARPPRVMDEAQKLLRWSTLGS
jgi:hypothetical protein